MAADCSRRLGRTFHFNRAGVWGVVLLRALTSREWGAAAMVLVVLVLPAVMACLPSGAFQRWRVPLKIADNLLQISLGCCTHRLIYPNPTNGEPSSFQVAAVLLTGNGVPWQLFNSVWDSIPFRYALPQQAVLTIVLLLSNRTLCSGNVAIQHAYKAIQRSISRAAGRLPPALALLHGGGAALAALQTGVGCSSALDGAAAAQGGPQAACTGAEAAATDNGVVLCMAYQPISQLLLGFVLPTYLIWNAELRSRRAFLAARNGSAAAGVADGSGMAPGRLGGQPAHGTLGTLPGLVEYLMFTVPAVLCMWSLVAVHV